MGDRLVLFAATPNNRVQAVRVEDLGDDGSPVPSEYSAKAFVKVMESDPRVLLTRENQERALILLHAALCPLQRKLGHENHGPHMRGTTFGIDWNRRGEEGTVGVPLFITGHRARRTNVRWDTLSDDLYPIATNKIIPIFWELQRP